MLFSAVDHPAIACMDVQKQIDWYCRVLGMRVVATDGKTPPGGAVVGYGEGTVSGTSGGAVIELMAARDPGPAPQTFARWQPGLRHVALRVSDFHKAYARLKEAGVTFLGEAGKALGGGPIVSFRDPEGNELQIVQRPAVTLG